MARPGFERRRDACLARQGDSRDDGLLGATGEEGEREEDDAAAAKEDRSRELRAVPLGQAACGHAAGRARYLAHVDSRQTHGGPSATSCVWQRDHRRCAARAFLRGAAHGLGKIG